MIRQLYILSCIFVCFSCTSTKKEEKEAQGNGNALQDNVIFFSESWPSGFTYKLTDHQALVLKEIAWGTEIADPFSKLPENTTVSPASDFSYFTIYGKTFNFIPPSSPHNFRLSPERNRKFARFIAEEFGITTRWQKPKPKGEQAVAH